MRDNLPMPDVPSINPTDALPHVASVGALVATMVGWLPFIVALIPAVYYCILIWESKTVQGWVAARRQRKAEAAAAKSAKPPVP